MAGAFVLLQLSTSSLQRLEECFHNLCLPIKHVGMLKLGVVINMYIYCICEKTKILKQKTLEVILNDLFEWVEESEESFHALKVYSQAAKWGQ